MWAGRGCCVAALVVAILSTAAAAPRYTPHLVARLPSKAERRTVGSGKRIATISALYEVDTLDWEGMKLRSAERLATALEGISPDYIETSNIEAYVIGVKCVQGALRCNQTGSGAPLLSPGFGGWGPEGDLSGTDPRECVAMIASNPTIYNQYIPRSFDPQWPQGDAALLEAYAFRTPLCVSPQNTSLYQTYYTSLEHVYVTGWRDAANSYITSKPGQGIRFELHVVGRIPVKWAQFLNVKFILNGSIPMPLYQPEIVDESAYWTDRLNISVQILGLRQSENNVDALITTIPVCIEPKVQNRGCFRFDHALFDHPSMSEYKLKSYITWRKHLTVKVASAQPWGRGDFNVSEGPWPVFQWRDPPPPPLGPWRRWAFPQKESVYEEGCSVGLHCQPIPLSPALRHLHSAVVYTSWNFEQHARRYLCDERPECGSDCLTNLTCLGGVSYYDQSFYFRSSQFWSDDNGVVPKIGLEDRDCPESCCANRRLCMRVRDVMGYDVPFDTPHMLVFGGKTYGHVKGPDGKLVYHNCEQIPRSEVKVEWRSCTESVVADLWRYDIIRGRWDFIKPASAINPATLLPMGYPVARFGHAAVLIEDVDGRDPGLKRLYMYIYGGLGPLCQGICNDVWRYEVPWAAQAYYPKFPDGPWNRGNYWQRLKDCPFGGLYRHKMTATSGNEYVYVFGGQVLGGFRSTLYRYRVSTDMWEDLNPYGRVSLTRLMYDFSGAPRPREVPTSEYNATLDVDCSTAWRFDGPWQHCRECPQCGLRTAQRGEGADFPEERADFAIASFADFSPGAIDDTVAIFGGYRTTWGAASTFQCQTTTTTTGKPMRTAADVILTTPSRYTTPPMTTTVVDNSGFSVVGTFPNSGSDSALASTTATTTAVRRLQGSPDEVQLEGPGQCDARFYFNDLWVFDAGLAQWVRRSTVGEAPLARRGHGIVVRRARTNDPQLVLFGGHNQDTSLNDMWLFDAGPAGEPTWTRIDLFLEGPRPPSMSYFSMVYAEALNMFVVFGGLHWRATNLTDSDRVRNIDRRCFKEAQGLPLNERDTSEAIFVNRMQQLCDTTAFCCVLTQQGSIPDDVDGTRTRNSTGGLDLVAISTICRKDCEAKAFVPEFYPLFAEGVWGFQTEACLHGCSGHGTCDMSFCVCEPSWYGRDCSQRRCPGSTCYTHPRTREQHCVECSQHGRCVDGECICFPGWGYQDCSAVLCEANCSSTPADVRGVCVEDFPVSQCHCFGHWSGSNCSELLCLNGCSQHGRCVAGSCVCDEGYHGADCSLFFLSL